MEKETAGSNEEITNKGDQEDLIMSVLDAALDSFVCQVLKEQVGKGVDDLC